jgi:hypothetical protein
MFGVESSYATRSYRQVLVYTSGAGQLSAERYDLTESDETVRARNFKGKGI